MAVDRGTTSPTLPRPVWTGDEGHETGMEAGMKVKIYPRAGMKAGIDLRFPPIPTFPRPAPNLLRNDYRLRGNGAPPYLTPFGGSDFETGRGWRPCPPPPPPRSSAIPTYSHCSGSINATLWLVHEVTLMGFEPRPPA